MRAAFEASPSRCGDRARTIHILEQDVVVESTRTRELLCPLELKSMSFSSSYLFDSDLHGIRYTTTRAERSGGRAGVAHTRLRPPTDSRERAAIADWLPEPRAELTRSFQERDPRVPRSPAPRQAGRAPLRRVKAAGAAWSVTISRGGDTSRVPPALHQRSHSPATPRRATARRHLSERVRLE